MQHIITAAQDILSKNIVDVYTAILRTDIEPDAKAYHDHFFSMANYLYKIHTYTKFSDIIKDIENGEWEILLLFNDEHEGVSYLLEEINAKANEIYNTVKFI